MIHQNCLMQIILSRFYIKEAYIILHTHTHARTHIYYEPPIDITNKMRLCSRIYHSSVS